MTDDAFCELASLEKIYLAVVEAYPHATIVITCTGSIVVFNLAAELLFGYSREEMMGKQVDLLVPEDRRAKHVLGREEYCNEPHTIETASTFEGLRKNGTRFQVQIRLAPVVVSGLGICFMAVVRRIKDGTIALTIEAERGKDFDSAPVVIS